MSAPRTPLSLLDLAVVGRDDTVADALAATVDVARAAEARGFDRIWYAEHHNMSSIASAATAVLIAHVAASTDRIPLGSGGIMLPNHSPLAIAEQFGTLAALHPGRIELGLGRAPGSDPAATRALRRHPQDAEHFPEDVRELQALLAGDRLPSGVKAVPGAGTNVPLTILGSSLFGAQLAADMGLPYGFASHFAPAALEQAVAVYRQAFRPSNQLDAPRVIAAINVVIADDADDAVEMRRVVTRQRVAAFVGRGRRLEDDELDAVLASPQGRQIVGMMRYTAVGTPSAVRRQLDEFAEHADADELIVVLNAPTIEQRLRAVDLLADAYPAATPVR